MVKTFLDDQINTVAVNVNPPGPLLLALVPFIFKWKLKAFRSTIFWAFLAVSVFGLMIQMGLIFYFGHIFSETPIPQLLGECGIPIMAPKDTSVEIDYIALAVNQEFLTADFQRASQRLSFCKDEGNAIVCPNAFVNGRSFKWEAEESEPNYCWFGKEGCFINSTTIT